MKKRKTVSVVFGAFALLMMIVDSKTVMNGMSAGMELCIQSLIPAVFPFLVVSTVLTGALGGSLTSYLAVGFLSGYPVGAKNVTDGWRGGALSKDDAQRMLAFCSNAGPSFLFGMIGPMFEQWYIPWMLWMIHILGALVSAAVASPKKIRGVPAGVITLVQALYSSVRTMGIICGWVVLFRVMISFLEKWCFWAIPDGMFVLVSGLLELVNGCVRLGQLELDGLRYLIAGVMLAAGGCCVTMQTVSVCEGLSLQWYFHGKCIQCAVSILLCSLTQFVFLEQERVFLPGAVVAAVILLLFSVVVLGKCKNCSSNPELIGV